MITKLATPGVYVDEVPMLPPSVAEVESAIPAFVGYTEKDTFQGVSIKNIPKKVSSMADFILIFGGRPDAGEDAITVAVDKTVEGGLPKYKVTPSAKPFTKNILWYAMKHFFDNGGANCYVVSVGTFDEPDKDDLEKGIDAIEDFDEPTMLLCPEATQLADVAKCNEVMQRMVSQAAKSNLRDRIAIVDIFDKSDAGSTTQSDRINGDIDGFRSISIDIQERSYGVAYYPNLETTYSYNYDFTKIKVSAFTVNGGAPDPIKDEKIAANATLESIRGSFVFNAVKNELENIHVDLPPSAAMAGVITNVDKTRGYWKAPANVTVKSVVAPKIILSNAQQENLNIDATSGKSVNVIRQFPGQGNVVWGARTLDGNSNEWRYVNVRRFFMVVEESIKKSINWAVFEPNTAQTWVLVQSMIENYLFLKWRDGALAGTKPEDAFFVRIGINKTMTPQDILEGKMIVEIGMAVARPAEFIVLKFMQLMQKS
jgi:uncharacterized protein